MEITEQIKKTYLPNSALIVYRLESETYQHGDYYMETRKIRKDGTLGPAQPISRKFLTALVKEYKNVCEMKPFGPIPKNLIYADATLGHEKYIWWNPPMRKTLYFSDGTGMEENEYNMPGTVFVVQQNELSVYAFKGRKPGNKTRLLYGPFYNYYKSGKICTGSAKKEWPGTIRWDDIITHWEAIFWNSIN